MAKVQQQVLGVATPEQIAAWKKAHGDIFCYEADGLVCYFKRPTRLAISMASAEGAADPLKFAEIIITNCWLGGDNALRDQDKYFIGLSQKLGEIVEVTVGELKKL